MEAIPTAVGLNTTLTVHVAPIANVAVQEPPARVKVVEPVKVNVPPVRARLPELVTVIVWGPLVVAIAWLPKAKVLGDTVNDAVAGADPNSIAPGSKLPPVCDSPGSGLRLP